ncbi:unnamed protein product [Malus baccata var. baccata]
MKIFQNKTPLSLPCTGAFSLPPFILSSFPSPSREATLGIWMSMASTLASAPPSLSVATSRLRSSTWLASQYMNNGSELTLVARQLLSWRRYSLMEVRDDARGEAVAQ